MDKLITVYLQNGGLHRNKNKWATLEQLLRWISQTDVKQKKSNTKEYIFYFYKVKRQMKLFMILSINILVIFRQELVIGEPCKVDPWDPMSVTSRPGCECVHVVIIHKLHPQVLCIVFNKNFIFKSRDGLPEWLRGLSVQLWLRSRLCGLWVRVPHQALCWQLRARNLLQILCLPLSLPLLCSCSVFLCLKHK